MEKLTPLFNLTFPKADICGERELYFRGQNVSYSEDDGTLTLDKGGVVSFDTFFNCFSFSKYLRFTTVKELIVKIDLKGRATFKLVAYRKGGKEILTEGEVDFPKKGEAVFSHDFSRDNLTGFYYIELTALSDDTVIYGGGFFTAIPPIADTKIAVLICTYKREKYLCKNMEQLARYLHSAPELRKRISVFVVDNAHTVEEGMLPYDFVTVFGNKNYGGSGGFARGMMEAHCKESGFSHMLLMDDDIVLEPEVISKTISFLSLRRPEYHELCVGGAMLEIECPYHLYEAAGIWSGRKVINVNKGLDLRRRENVFKNERFFKADYNAWWYMCMPLSFIEKHGFPLPFFIKGDDIEYSLRCAEHIAFLSGIAVWHMGFENKDIGHYEYYIKRNEAVINALYRKGVLKEIWKLFLYSGRKIAKRRYALAELGFRAYNDFLKGPDFFLHIDAEQLNSELQSYYKEGKARGFFGSCFRFVALAFKLLFKYRKTCRSYKKRLSELSSMEFWKKHLEIMKDCDTMDK